MGLLRETSQQERKSTVLVVVVTVVFLLAYLLLFPRILPPEWTIIPSKATELTEIKNDKLSVGGSYFVLGSWEGYWNADGKVEMARTARPGATAWAESLAWFDSPHNRVVVEGLSGAKYSIAGEQYPFWLQGRLFTMDPNRMGIKAWSTDGQLLWSKQFADLITAVDASSALTVIGTLDGDIEVFDKSGTLVTDFQPGGSRLPVIYNVSVSATGNSILALAGVDPKRFLVLQKGSSEFRPVFHRPLQEQSPWPTPLGFLQRGTIAYYQSEAGLTFLDPNHPSAESKVFALSGAPIALESLPSTRLVSIVERDHSGSALHVVAPTGAGLARLPFQGSNILVQRQGNGLMLGVDQTVLKFEVSIQ